MLIRGLEAGEIPDDVDPVFEESWFGAMADDDAGEAAEEAGEDEEDDENADNLNMFRPRF
ncbi:hypothetical protein BRC73_02605 [Halobacteriales archaeon QH_7_66_37]|nr:MAG: hypothetical protein BRC73_02605 [Halobacteriales archaeon QH_7_66_37]